MMFQRLFLMVCLVAGLVVGSTPTFAQSKASPKTPTKSANTRPLSTNSEMALGRITSDKAIFNFVTNGWKKPAADTKNKSELLWAEKSVQDFMQQLFAEIQKTADHHAEGNEQAKLAASTVPVLLSAAMQHPMAICLNSFTISDKPEINFALVIDTESDMEKVREAFDKLVESAPKDGPNALVEETVDGVRFYRPNMGQNEGPVPQFGMLKSYFVFTFGPTTMAETLQKIYVTGKTPVWLDATLKDLKVDRPSTVWQVDVEGILKIVDPLIPDTAVRKALDASGVLALKRLASVTGLDAVGMVDKLVVETNGAPKGVLALLPDKPLTPSDLKGIPSNAAQASVVRFDLNQTVETALKIIDKVDPMPRQQFDMISTQGEAMLGFSLKNDFLKGFGDVWGMWVSSQGTENGVVITASVRDQKKLLKVQEELVKRANQFLLNMPQAPITLNEFTQRTAKGYTVQINNPMLPIPISPTWVITKDQFVLGTTKEIVTTHLTPSTSLAENEAVKAALKRDPKTVLVTYRDPKPELQGVYATIDNLKPIMAAQLQQMGVEFELPPLPPLSDLEPHLAPSVGTLTRSANGWRSESRGVVPSVSAASPATAAVLVALLLPAVSQAREAARRTQGKNNLKQIGLAMHNYHDTYNSFPERVVLDKNKKPGLSWRVKLLPYMDENVLYQQFKLDEPWDSDNNKPLLAKLPNCYSSPNDPDLNAQGKTRYLIPVMPGGLFDGEAGPKISQVTDGTSNTIMVVEARSDHAVNWTEPSDLQIDIEDMLAGLKSARVGGFHALMADGAVRFISDNIFPATLKALLTRAGAEVVGDF